MLSLLFCAGVACGCLLVVVVGSGFVRLCLFAFALIVGVDVGLVLCLVLILFCLFCLWCLLHVA